jgi:hypothetical protein
MEDPKLPLHVDRYHRSRQLPRERGERAVLVQKRAYQQKALQLPLSLSLSLSRCEKTLCVRLPCDPHLTPFDQHDPFDHHYLFEPPLTPHDCLVRLCARAMTPHSTIDFTTTTYSTFTTYPTVVKPPPTILHRLHYTAM